MGNYTPINPTVNWTVRAIAYTYAICYNMVFWMLNRMVPSRSCESTNQRLYICYFIIFPQTGKCWQSFFSTYIQIFARKFFHHGETLGAQSIGCKIDWKMWAGKLITCISLYSVVGSQTTAFTASNLQFPRLKPSFPVLGISLSLSSHCGSIPLNHFLAGSSCFEMSSCSVFT